MNRKEMLERAIETVCNDRQGQYGRPENTFDYIGEMWSLYLFDETGHISAKTVADMMILLKIAREKIGQHKDDNYIDIAGYAACACELAGGE